LPEFIFPAVKKYFILTRFPLSVSVGFTGMVSYFAACPHFRLNALPVFAGIFLLAAGASALNQFQEKDFDARMKRTSRRPLPAGLMSVPHVIFFSLFSILTGLLMLYLSGNIEAMIAGIIIVLWYNLVYTYLKRRTAFAIFIGIFTGVGPVLIGWLTAGGEVTETGFLSLVAFMCVWQIPHFLILMLMYEEEYRAAGFPLLTDIISVNSVKALVILSSLILSANALMIAYLHVIHSGVFQLMILILSLSLLLKLVISARRKKNAYKSDLMVVNIYMMLVMLCLFMDRMILWSL
jgi:heme o synthase